MKNFKSYFACLAVFAFLFTSCSKDEETARKTNNQEVATLSFATVLNDLTRRAEKAHLNDFPVCSDEAPSYVVVRITGEGYEGPVSLEIPLSDNPGDYDDDGEAEYFTLENSDLELPEGNYTLNYFAVFNSTNDIIWVAPSTNEPGILVNYVNNQLPIQINLIAGTKKYVDVEVLCYDQRMVNEYGYLFFELETKTALDFCFFANYCIGDRHFVANYSVNIWLGEDANGTPLYTNIPAPVSAEGEFSADPLCFALPSPPEGVEDDEAYLYYEVSLEPWDGYYPAPGEDVISGTLSLNDIEANFDGDDNVNYEHLRFGCDPDQNTCPGQDNDDDGQGASCDNCPDDFNPDQADSDGDGVGDDCDNCKDNPGDVFGCHDDTCVGDDPDQDGVPASCDICEEGDDNVDSDYDGVPDACDDCPNEAGDIGNFGCPNDPCVGEDSDNDGVADICDVCEDGDDNVDENANGIPDDCENDNGGGACETAFMFGNNTINSFSNSNRWGWAENFDQADNTETYNIWAGAGQNDTSKGTHVGNATVTLNDDGDVELSIDLFSGFSIDELHVNLSENRPSGKVAKAPGQYNRNGEVSANTLNYTFDFNNTDGDFWIIVHAVACGIDD